MDSPFEFFANDRYKILKILYENCVTVKGESYTSLSQQEIADIAHFSKKKTNQIINELINNDFIAAYKNKKGKYVLTAKGHIVILVINKTSIE